MRMDLPRTPVKGIPQDDIIDDDSSVILSPTYTNGSGMNNEVSMHHMKGYHHGLSSKKVPDRNSINLNLGRDTTPTLFSISKKSAAGTADADNTEFNKAFDNISDMSLDLGRNDTENDNGTASLQPDYTTKKTLEQLDINKMFESDPKNMTLKYSPLKLATESPNKDTPQEQDDENPRKKLKLDSVPNLGRDDINESESIEMSSPVAIEMIDAKVNSSPLQLSDTEVHDNNNSDNNIDYDKSSIISSDHKLTPVHQQDHINDEDNNDSDFINMVARRNEDLIGEIHQFNSKINTLSVSFDKLNEKYRVTNLNKVSLQNNLDALQNKMDGINAERDNLTKSNENLKTKLKEVRDEIKMLNSNQNLLQSKYDSVSSDNEKNKEMKTELERNLQTLQRKNQEIAELLTKTETEKNEVVTNLEEQMLANEALSEGNEHKSLDIESYKSELTEKKEELIQVQEKLDKLLDSQHNNSDDLLETVKTLTSERDDLELKLNNLTEAKNKEIDDLKSRIDELNTRIDTTNDELLRAKDDIVSKTTDAEGKEEELVALRKSFEEANDECKIRVAEVTELNIEIESLKESKIHLEESNNRLLEELGQKKQECINEIENYKKASIEIESVQLKNSNIENEYLVELESLHKTVTSLEGSLKSNHEFTENLKIENEKLKSLLEAKTSNQKDDEVNSEDILKSNEKILELENKLKESEDELEKIRKNSNDSIQGKDGQITEWKKKLEEKDKDTNKRLRLLAEDLYHQYSSKHEQKVKSLKKTYEKKYESQIEKLNIEQHGLQEEIERLNKQLRSERDEKRELLKSIEKDN